MQIASLTPPILVFLVFSILLATLTVYLVLLATFVTIIDVFVPRLQRFATITIIWLIPVVGALWALRMVAEHSPEVIARVWIPWPFRKAIEGSHFGGVGPGNANGNEDLALGHEHDIEGDHD